MNTPWFNRTPTFVELKELIEKAELSDAQQAELRETINRRSRGDDKAV